MKIRTSASSIILFSCFFLLSGCESIHVPSLFEHDEVPSEIKAAPRLVQTPPPSKDDEAWPRLGDVPARPTNLTPKAEHERHIEELENERAASEAAKREVLQNDPKVGDAATQNSPSPASLEAPQF